MHEIHDNIDRVVIVTGHPLSGMGNWHRKGTVYDSSIPWPVVLETLGMDGDQAFTVEKLPIWHAGNRPTTAELKDAFGWSYAQSFSQRGWVVLKADAQVEAFRAVANTADLNDTFDCVSATYEVIQNDTLTDLAEVFIEAAQVERGVTIPILSAGTLRARRLAFLSLGLPNDDALDGLPARGQALNLGTSHDRTNPLMACLASTIVVCGNTYRANLLGRPAEVQIRHTASAPMRVELARMVLRDMIGAATELDGQIHRLLNEELPSQLFGKDALEAVLGERPADEGRGRTMYDTRRSDIIDEMMSPRVPAEYRNTAWGGLMAVQGWEQHSRTQRGGRHRAAVAVEKLVANRAADGYPAAHKYMEWARDQYPQAFNLEAVTV